MGYNSREQNFLYDSRLFSSIFSVCRAIVCWIDCPIDQFDRWKSRNYYHTIPVTWIIQPRS